MRFVALRCGSRLAETHPAEGAVYHTARKRTFQASVNGQYQPGQYAGYPVVFLTLGEGLTRPDPFTEGMVGSRPNRAARRAKHALISSRSLAVRQPLLSITSEMLACDE